MGLRWSIICGEGGDQALLLGYLYSKVSEPDVERESGDRADREAS